MILDPHRSERIHVPPREHFRRFRLPPPPLFWVHPGSAGAPWLHRYSRVTTRLAHSVARLCRRLPVKHVAEFYGLGWDAVKDIDKSTLEAELGPPDLDGVDLLAMDEFAIQKGQRYATVVMDARRKRVLWVGRGRDRDCMKAFFKLLGPERCARIRAVAMDMHAAFFLEVQAHCPNAELVFDLFHVAAKYGREVIDRVRVDEANRLRNDKRSQRHQGSALVVGPQRVEHHQERGQGQAQRAARRQPSHLRGVRHAGRLEAPVELPLSVLSAPSVERLVPPRRSQSAQAAGRVRETTGRIRSRHHRSCSLAATHEPAGGYEQQDQVIKRMAYGLRDDEYFFLKIRAAFPGKPG